MSEESYIAVCIYHNNCPVATPHNCANCPTFTPEPPIEEEPLRLSPPSPKKVPMAIRSEPCPNNAHHFVERWVPVFVCRDCGLISEDKE
jgi:hypothetical protein